MIEDKEFSSSWNLFLGDCVLSLDGDISYFTALRLSVVVILPKDCRADSR